jgi:cytoskeletal protein CcmA (bactofilin family)
MAERVNPRDLSINTIIGPGTSVSGDIESAGFTRVDGSMRGDLTAKGRVVIGENARMKSNISGTNITIGGVVYGNVTASEKLVILTTGLVVGDIITRHIKTDEGALVDGRIVICASDEKWEAEVSRSRDARSVHRALETRSHG